MDKLSIVIRAILFLGLMGSLWFILGNNITVYFKGILAKRKRLNQFEQITDSKKDSKNWFSKIIRFKAIAGLEAENVIIISLVVFLFAIVVLSYYINLSAGTILTSIAFGLLPIVFKRIKLEEKRIKGSYDGKEIVALVINNYHICNKSMERTLERVALEIKTKYSKEVFTQLAREVKIYKNSERLHQIVDSMHYAYDTTWSKLLSYAIFSAVENAQDVTDVLEDILSYFKRLNESAEVNKRYNNETNKLLQFFVPISYIGLMWYGASLYGYTLIELLKKQFSTPANIQLFILIVIGYIICIVFARLLNQPKYDL